MSQIATKRHQAPLSSRELKQMHDAICQQTGRFPTVTLSADERMTLAGHAGRDAPELVRQVVVALTEERPLFADFALDPAVLDERQQRVYWLRGLGRLFRELADSADCQALWDQAVNVKDCMFVIRQVRGEAALPRPPQNAVLRTSALQGAEKVLADRQTHKRRVHQRRRKHEIKDGGPPPPPKKKKKLADPIAMNDFMTSLFESLGRDNPPPAPPAPSAPSEPNSKDPVRPAAAREETSAPSARPADPGPFCADRQKNMCATFIRAPGSAGPPVAGIDGPPAQKACAGKRDAVGSVDRIAEGGAGTGDRGSAHDGGHPDRQERGALDEQRDRRQDAGARPGAPGPKGTRSEQGAKGGQGRGGGRAGTGRRPRPG